MGREEDERVRRIEHTELEEAAANPWPYGGKVPGHTMNAMAPFIAAERRRVLEKASPAQRERMRAAEQRGRVFRAWNMVMDASPDVSREKEHVTGLFYDEARNALVVYVDSDVWCQELSMKRDVLRTRMSFQGVELARVVCRRSREGYERKR